MPKKSKALATKSSVALIGVDAGAEYWPSISASAEGAHKLTGAVVALAFQALEQERQGGSELPDVEVADPGTGEITMNPAYELMLRERALVYLQTMGMESEASTFEILAEINERQLYMWGAEPWESLAQFVRSLGEGKSPTYASVWERMATRVLPALQVERVAGIQEVMDIIVQGGKSNLSLLLPELLQAADDGDADTLKEILADARLPRSKWWSKYKGDKAQVPPARATLTYNGPGWQLVICMTEAQKGIILNRLGPRVKYTTLKATWAQAWKRVAKKWRRRALLLERDNDSQRAIASQVPYLKERIKDLERQIPARTFDAEDYMIGRG